METIVDEGSPLASYLQAKGEAGAYHSCYEYPSPQPPSTPYSFAPQGRRTITRRLNQYHPQQRWTSVALSRIRGAYAFAVSSTLGKVDNERFLEHFRYNIIASQLLNEHVGASRPIVRQSAVDATLHSPGASTTIYGAILSAALAFGVVWIINWVRHGSTSDIYMSRIFCACLVQLVAAVLLYALTRRQWLKYLRRQAVGAASEFVNEAHNFESAASSVLRLVQEIELVSRGYRISSPLPPISRIENKNQSRKCPRLRRNLRMAYATAIPTFKAAINILRSHVNEDDLERYLEVYDIRSEDVQEALLSTTNIGIDSEESLLHLRAQQFRLSTLRRVMLCELLSLPADGRHADGERWRAAVAQMENLTVLLHELAQKIATLLHEEEHPPHFPVPIIPRLLFPTSEMQTYHHHLSSLALHLRTLQAKMHILRSESTRLLTSPNATPPPSSPNISSTSVSDQYEAMGADVHALLQAWEDGRASFQEFGNHSTPRFNTGAHMDRLGVHVAADNQQEDAAGVAEALRLLDGGMPASPPLSAFSGSGDENVRPEEDFEVFEAIALPRQRSVLSREQRVAKMREERDRVVKGRGERDEKNNLVRELQAVINMRPSAAQGTRRMTML